MNLENLFKENQENLSELVFMLREKRDKKKELEAQIKNLNEEIRNIESILLEKMREQGLNQLRTETGLVYTQKVKRYKVLDKEILRDIVPEELWTVNYQTLQSFLKEREEQGEALPEGIEVEEEEFVRFRRR